MGHKSKRRCKIMAKVSGKYETLFIVNPTLGEEEVAAVAQKTRLKTKLEA